MTDEDTTKKFAPFKENGRILHSPKQIRRRDDCNFIIIEIRYVRQSKQLLDEFLRLSEMHGDQCVNNKSSRADVDFDVATGGIVTFYATSADSEVIRFTRRPIDTWHSLGFILSVQSRRGMRFMTICLAVPLCSLVLSDTTDEEYCTTCQAMMTNCMEIYDDDFSSITEAEILSTTSSLCGKYFIGFEEVVCRILCQVNAHDLLHALRNKVPMRTICEKGGVCLPMAVSSHDRSFFE